MLRLALPLSVPSKLADGVERGSARWTARRTCSPVERGRTFAATVRPRGVDGRPSDCRSQGSERRVDGHPPGLQVRSAPLDGRASVGLGVRASVGRAALDSPLGAVRLTPRPLDWLSALGSSDGVRPWVRLGVRLPVRGTPFDWISEPGNFQKM